MHFIWNRSEINTSNGCFQLFFFHFRRSLSTLRNSLSNSSSCPGTPPLIRRTCITSGKANRVFRHHQVSPNNWTLTKLLHAPVRALARISELGVQKCVWSHFGWIGCPIPFYPIALYTKLWILGCPNSAVGCPKDTRTTIWLKAWRQLMFGTFHNPHSFTDCTISLRGRWPQGKIVLSVELWEFQFK